MMDDFHVSNQYIAHTREDGEEQPLFDHLKGTAELAASFAAAFGAEADAKAVGMRHDIGKYSARFQQHIRHPEMNIRVDHATAGAQSIGFASPASFAIAGHHGGIPDGGSSGDRSDAGTLMGRLKKRVEDYAAWRGEQTPPNAAPPAFLTGADNFTLAFYTRMLYACLVDADYLDTERFMQGRERAACYDGIPALLERLKHYTKKWRPPKNELNAMRCRIYDDCVKAGALEKGLFTLTVPTGGGKTVSSLAFALNHAKARGLSRVIYVIPYTSIIDQTAAVFREILGEENVVEHHGGAALSDDEATTPRQYRKLLSTENWDAPVVVTTAVQFFESLFSNRSSACRKLHNIAGSVLIFDEAQTLPVKYLTPCVAAVAQLVQHYGASAVLCTATQPALENLFAGFGVPTREICADTGALYTFFKRVRARDLGEIETDALAERLTVAQAALCVFNRRATAKMIYEKLPPEGRYCLTTLLYPKHRLVRFTEIKQRLRDDLPCRVVSTSLIEAGVDVDFPVVYRELAGLDSFIQTAGRCNREGKRPLEDSVAYLFRFPERAPAYIQQNISATRRVAQNYGDLMSPEAVRAYFTFLRFLKGEVSLDADGVMDAFRRGIAGCAFPFAQIASTFKIINEGTKTVYIPTEDNAPLIAALREGFWSRALFRKLGGYGVSVYPDHFMKLYGAAALEVLDTGDAILTDSARYSEETGLAMDVENGIGIFR